MIFANNTITISNMYGVKFPNYTCKILNEIDNILILRLFMSFIASV